MVSKKPKFVSYSDEITIKKLSKIAKLESRTVSQQIDYLAKKYIEAYEKEHGEIKIGDE